LAAQVSKITPERAQLSSLFILSLELPADQGRAKISPESSLHPRAASNFKCAGQSRQTHNAVLSMGMLTTSDLHTVLGKPPSRPAIASFKGSHGSVLCGPSRGGARTSSSVSTPWRECLHGKFLPTESATARRRRRATTFARVGSQRAKAGSPPWSCGGPSSGAILKDSSSTSYFFYFHFADLRSTRREGSPT